MACFAKNPLSFLLDSSILISGIFLVTPPVLAANQAVDEEAISYLKTLSIEELLQTEVTTVSKKPEQLFNVAAAVSVITQEDLRRSGVRTISDALRQVPGIQVAHLDGSRMVITSRGFADYYANKLLVLIDGRSVYTPLFSGVFWDVQDTLIEDIDRIEVIRGPGATVWGANAVNGVVNIITKRAEQTQGTLVVAEAGTHDRPMAAVRYGGTYADGGFYRFWAKGVNRENYKQRDGGVGHDGSHSARAGFVVDWQAGDEDDMTLQGEMYEGKAQLSLVRSGFLEPPYNRLFLDSEAFSGGHLLGRWKHTFSVRSATELQAYYDRANRDQIAIYDARDTIDLELKHHWEPGNSHDLVGGVGYRWMSDVTDGTFNTSFDPENRSDDLFSAFVQDDIAIISDRFWVTLGSKFEHNDYSGFEIQPSIRARLKPASNKIVWAAVSRAVRTPSRAESDIVSNQATVEANLAVGQEIGGNNRSLVRILGNSSMEAEELIAYEAGFRWQPLDTLTFDIATFYNDYDKLRTSDPGMPFLEAEPKPLHLVFPQNVGNSLAGNTYGLELQATWQAMKRLKISGGYSLLDLDLEFKDPNRNEVPLSTHLSPKHQASLRSYLDLPGRTTLDGELYYVDELEGAGVDGYLRLDLRFSWRPTADLELSVNAENLLDDGHQEFVDRSGILASEVPRLYSVKLNYTF